MISLQIASPAIVLASMLAIVLYDAYKKGPIISRAKKTWSRRRGTKQKSKWKEKEPWISGGPLRCDHSHKSTIH